MSADRRRPPPVAVNLLGLVEHPVFGGRPYRVDADGSPYVPVGDGGMVLGVRLGESVFDPPPTTSPQAPAWSTRPAARHALSIYACIGNHAVIRTGLAAGAPAGARQAGREGPGDLGFCRMSWPGSGLVTRCVRGIRPGLAARELPGGGHPVEHSLPELLGGAAHRVPGDGPVLPASA